MVLSVLLSVTPLLVQSLGGTKTCNLPWVLWSRFLEVCKHATPWKINGWNLQPSPQKWKEHDLNQTSRDDMFQPFIFRGVSDCGSITPCKTCYGNRRLDQSRNIFAGKDGDFGDGKLDLPKSWSNTYIETLTGRFFFTRSNPCHKDHVPIWLKPWWFTQNL